MKEKETKWKKLLLRIYPPVRQDKLWLRIMRVVGWTLSILSVTLFPITFVLYFGVIQRVILYIVYGNKKELWKPEKSQ